MVKTDETGAVTEICLAMKKRGFGVGMWNGTGGKPNEGEEIEAAARREAQEELGISIKKFDKLGIINFTLRQEDKNVQMHSYLVLDWEGEPQETEEMLPKWFKSTEIPFDQMWKSDREWLPILLKGKKFVATYTYACEGGEVETREITEVTSF